MKFLIDAQLPRRLAIQLTQAGFEVTHTLDLLNIHRLGEAFNTFDFVELNRTSVICHL